MVVCFFAGLWYNSPKFHAAPKEEKPLNEIVVCFFAGLWYNSPKFHAAPKEEKPLIKELKRRSGYDQSFRSYGLGKETQGSDQ